MSRNTVLVSLVNLIVGLLAFPICAAEKPNIIVIMADDLGFGDVSCNGATAVKTPNIDRLAAEGVRFTSGYSSGSTCTPTRYSFMTGQYAFRKPGTGIAPPDATALIRPGTPTIASALKEAGYRTAVVGKWHLGLGQPPKPDWNGELKPGPLEIGFDHCFLLPTTNDRIPSVYVEDHRVKNLDPKDPLWTGAKPPTPDYPNGITLRDQLKMNWSHGHNNTVHNGIGRIGFFTGGKAARWRDEDLADAWVGQSVKWIEANQNNPFFLFFAAHDIHVPRMPHERFQGKSTLGYRGDAILELDWSVGQLVETLERLKLKEKTLIVFCSDNGPVLDDGYQDGSVAKNGDHTPSGPFRGGKNTVLEGGTRTPFIACWPGRIPPGVSEQIVSTLDLARSFAALANSPISADAFPDSENVLDALLGAPGAKGREELVQQANIPQQLGFRSGDWKLVRNLRPKGQFDDALYQLAQDPRELNNLAAQHPEILARLQSRLQEITRRGQP